MANTKAGSVEAMKQALYALWDEYGSGEYDNPTASSRNNQPNNIRISPNTYLYSNIGTNRLNARSSGITMRSRPKVASAVESPVIITKSTFAML